MKIMLVIHGYPMRYNASSEVYTQGLALELAHRHEVHFFTHQENSFLPEYACSWEVDLLDSLVTFHVLNMARFRDRFRHIEVDRQFGAVLDRLAPDTVLVGHLSHLSTSLVLEASRLCWLLRISVQKTRSHQRKQTPQSLLLQRVEAVQKLPI